MGEKKTDMVVVCNASGQYYRVKEKNGPLVNE